MLNRKNAAYEQLRLRLLRGEFSPGTQLKEAPLSQELGLSRTPIRAALKKLVADGLATADGSQGVRVAEHSADDLDELFQLRIMLEPYAVQRAIERAGPQIAVALRRFNEAMERGIELGDAEGMSAVQTANLGFHRTLLDACGPSRVRTILVGIAENPVILRGFYLYSREELEQSLHHHKDLTLAAEAGNPRLARQAMELHLQMAYQRFTSRRSEFLKQHAG